jgi:hypothetical protein
MGKIRAVQCWGDQQVLDCIVQTDNEPLPDVKELNDKIPQSDWRKDLTGKLVGPWQNVWGFYLCNPQDASTYTFVNSTVGSRIAYEKLNDRIEFMRAFRGANVAPIVKLDHRKMKTQFGEKLRPEFTVVSWVGLNGDAASAPAIEHKPAEAPALKTVSEPTTKEILNDEIGF